MRMDAFSQSLPSFNIKGKDKVSTIVGGFFTLILFLTVLMYAALKFSDIITQPNPIINTHFSDDRMDDKIIDLNKKNFRAAFTVESYLDPRKQKNDPRYVKYLFRIYGKKEGRPFQRIVCKCDLPGFEFVRGRIILKV